MAYRNLAPVRALAREACILAGKIDGNGSSALTQSTANTLGFTITRTNTGAYLITLADKWNALLACNITIQEDTSTGKYAEIDAVALSSKTIAFTVWDGATPSKADVPSTGEIHVMLVLSNTAQTPTRG